MKIFVLFLSLFFFGFISHAQKKVEISAAYGAPSVYGVTESLFSSLSNAFFKVDKVSSSSGVLDIQVNIYNANQKLRYGIRLDNEFFSTEGDLQKMAYLSVSPKADYFWSSAEHQFRFYSGLSVGIASRNLKYIDKDRKTEKSNDTLFAFNITPIGVKYGEDFSVFLDTNFGIVGGLQLGIGYQF